MHFTENGEWSISEVDIELGRGMHREGGEMGRHLQLMSPTGSQERNGDWMSIGGFESGNDEGNQFINQGNL
jgi:hypothetical protein